MEMEVWYRVTQEYVRSYDNALKLSAGERVRVDRGDTK